MRGRKRDQSASLAATQQDLWADPGDKSANTDTIPAKKTPHPPRPDDKAKAATPVTSKPNQKGKRKRTIGIIALVLLLLVGGGLLVKNDLFNQNFAGLRNLGNRPDDNPATNILLIGSDNRAGANAAYGRNVEGQRADVTILLQVSGDKKRATLVGIPRDSLVEQPECEDEAGKISPTETSPFNFAFARGGISCTVKTFEQLTRIRVDHFAVVDFTGFKNMVDALGTVSICLPKAVNDLDSGLNLPAGRQDVNGENALAYVRMRHGLDDNSDLARIKRQQAFLASVAQKATSSETLTNPLKLRRFIKAATAATTVDENFSEAQMLSLANTLNSIGLENINMPTLPTRPHPTNSNWVEWTAAANALWDQLRTDTYIPDAKETNQQAANSADQSGSPAAPVAPTWSTAADGTPIVTIAPDAISVQVMNSTNTKGLAAQVKAQLQSMGFNVVGTGTIQGAYEKTTVQYRPDMPESAATLLSAIAGSSPQSVPGMGATMRLVLGQNFTNVQKIMVQPSTQHIKVRKADQDICTQP